MHSLRNYFATALCFAIFLVFSTSVSAAETLYKVYVDGQLVTSSALAKNGSTVVPFRVILSKLNFNVQYDANEKSINAYKNEANIKFFIGSKRAYLNGAAVQLPVAPDVLYGVTYIPLRFVSESLNYRIELDKPAKAIYIDSTTGGGDSPASPSVKGGNSNASSTGSNNNPAQSPSTGELTTKQITEMNDGKVFVVLTDEAQGSAVSLGQGLFITNYHVIEGAQEAQIIDIKGKKYELAGIVDYDKKRDLAIVKTKVKLPNVRSVTIGDPAKLGKGERVVAIGTPLGQQNTVSEGVISNLIVNEGVRLLQISVPIDHGSSGGGLFNTRGELVGITTSGLESQANLNFAVSISEASGMLGKVSNRDFASISTTAFSGTKNSTPTAKPSTDKPQVTPGKGMTPEDIVSALNNTISYIPTEEGDVYLGKWMLIPGDSKYNPLIYTVVDAENYLTYLEGYPMNEDIVTRWAEMIGEVTSERVPGTAIDIAVFFEDFFKSYPSSFDAEDITKVAGGYEVSHIFISIRIDSKGNIDTYVTD